MGRAAVDEIHEQLRTVYAGLPPLTFVPRRLWWQRVMFGLFGRSRCVPGVRARDRAVGSRAAGEVGVRVYLPEGELERGPGPALLWFHGGGLIIGRPRVDERRCSEFARDLAMPVVSVRYRLAPRHPFPAALDDALAAWTWLVSAGAAELGVDPARVAVGGESAGGGLAACLAQRLADGDRGQPRAQVLIYPMLDDRTASRRELDALDHALWNNRSNHTGWSAYLGAEPGGEGSKAPPAYASAARRLDAAGGLQGLAPAWIGVGTHDLFWDECLAYAAGLDAAGVECKLERVVGGFHGFPTLAPKLPLSRAFHRAQVEFLRERLSPLEGAEP
ncbi:Alpha/beta hydrolase fold-3 protein [Plesiocystis pacifica SIR-1]|uniref:Alpha/beta hydrolase fold-3 protein n=1 Tax=Plesiocystis pacifica SIR-1 TaxID=391625 RepID=A6G7B5_9BACT|nr:alpha/beta hydrolase [Plesiocystis pacifica]EDM78249.1 Alpha/beta hydrolase fold-3 protein [Plesiocystis pacifica SIR-1]